MKKYSAIKKKKNEILSGTATWMELEVTGESWIFEFGLLNQEVYTMQLFKNLKFKTLPVPSISDKGYSACIRRQCLWEMTTSSHELGPQELDQRP